MTLPSTTEAQVFIAFDGTDNFDGPEDRVTPYTHHERGIEISDGRDGAQQLNPPKIATGGFNLKNDRGRFSNRNAGSPVYQVFIPGRPVQYLTRHGVRRTYRSHTLYRAHVPYRGMALYPLGRHIIDDINDSTEIGARQVSVDTIGYEAVLTRAPVTVALMTNPLVSECFTALLDAVGWPSDLRDIAVSDTRMLYWWCDARNPWDAMLELLASEGPGMFGVRRDGTFYFESRNSRTINARSATSQATFYDRIAGQQTAYRAHVLYRAHRLYRGRINGLIYSDLKPSSGFRSIYNRATYTTRRRTTAALAQVWQYGTALTLTSNQSVALYARPTDPFINAVSPVLSTDYTTTNPVTVTMTYSSGLVAIITITAGASGATIDSVVPGTGIQLRAQSLTVSSETTAINGTDASASIAKYSPIPGQNIPITLSVGGWAEIDTAVASGVCDAWVLRQQVERPSVSFRMQNVDAEALESILELRQSDRITLVHQNTGLNADFWVNAMQLQIHGAQGRLVDLIVQAELCDDVSGSVWDNVAALWDSAIWGV